MLVAMIPAQSYAVRAASMIVQKSAENTSQSNVPNSINHLTYVMDALKLSIVYWNEKFTLLNMLMTTIEMFSFQAGRGLIRLQNGYRK